jgi:hypothetical protein
MRIRAYLSAIAATLAFTACAPFGTSKAERVARLEYDLNGGVQSRQYAYQNFDPATTTDFVNLATQDPNQTWDQWFPPSEWPDTTRYVIDIQDIGSDSLTARVTGPVDFGGPRTLTVGLVRIGMEWYINRLELEGEVPPLIVD